MAVTRTNTSTRTYTRARMALIHVQFKSFAKRFGYPPKLVKRLPDAIDRRWVTALTVYANNAQGQAVASVELRIDWTAHDELKETSVVNIDARWRDDVSPQIGVYGESFEEFAREQDLTLEVRLTLSPEVRREPSFYQAVLAELDLRDGAPISWKGKPFGKSERIPSLAEVRAGVQFAE